MYVPSEIRFEFERVWNSSESGNLGVFESFGNVGLPLLEQPRMTVKMENDRNRRVAFIWHLRIRPTDILYFIRRKIPKRECPNWLHFHLPVYLWYKQVSRAG